MFKNIRIFSSFSVPDLEKAEQFYRDVLGLEVEKTPQGLSLHISGESPIFIYFSSSNKPADFTILNFSVDDVEKIVDELEGKGVRMEQYDLPAGKAGMPGIKTDEKGIARGDGEQGPRAMAWFKDPAGNILAIMQRPNEELGSTERSSANVEK